MNRNLSKLICIPKSLTLLQGFCLEVKTYVVSSFFGTYDGLINRKCNQIFEIYVLCLGAQLFEHANVLSEKLISQP